MPPQARDLAQIRFENAMALFDDFARATAQHQDASALRGLDGRFAELLLIQPSYWSQIKARSRQIGERLARQFEQRSDKPVGWLDQAHGLRSRTTADAGPQTDDERFVVSLILSYYRRDPERARGRLLELIGEALRPPVQPAATGAQATAHPTDAQLWSQARSAVAPLKRKR